MQPPQPYTQLKSVTGLGNSLQSDQLKANLAAFFNYGFLQLAGGYFNVTFPSPATNLRLVSDHAYLDGQVWEGYREGWVWESGASGSYPPIGVSGVWVDNVFRPSGFKIDYPNGRVVFTTPLATTSNVAMEFSFRYVRVDTSDSTWFQDLQFGTIDSLNTPDPQFAQVGSGAWDVLARNRVQLPALVVDPISRTRQTPYEIGNKTRVFEQDVLLHVLAETPYDRDQLHDIVVNQWNHDLYLFDKNAVDDADAWPLDSDGSPVASPLQYPDLVAPVSGGGFRWTNMFISEVRSEAQTSYPPLYRATCRLTCRIYLP